MLLVNDFLEHSAARTPDKLALVCDDRRLTYAELDAMANRFANALRDHSVERGDRVILFLPNTVELVVGIFGTLEAGGVFVVVNATTKRDKLAYLVNNCRATALVTRARQAAIADHVIQQSPSLKFTVFTETRDPQSFDYAHTCPAAASQSLAARRSCAALGDRSPISNIPSLTFDAIQERYPAARPPRQCIDRDLACLIYTSGSTGEAKGVMSAHSNVVFAASSIISYLENTPADVVLNVLPMSFDYGLYQLLMTFKFGGTLVLERSFAYPAQILKRMEKERVTGFPGVPTLFAILLQIDLSQYDLRSLRYLTNTAAALPPSHIRHIREKFPWATLYSMYGLTETKRTLYLPPDQLDLRPGSVGIAIPGTKVWIEDEAGNRLGPGQVGELVVRGGHVMRGYWEAPAATARRYRAGPLPGERVCYSGDLFRMDEDGYFYFVGRQDDIIKSRGEKVAPKEIENVLYSLPGVIEAAVVGVPDPILGQAIKAFVVCQDGTLSEIDVLRHCRAHLEDLMVPQSVEFRPALPKTDSGKIKKRELV